MVSQEHRKIQRILFFLPCAFRIPGYLRTSVESFGILLSPTVYMGLSGGASGKEPACQCRRLSEMQVQSLGQEDPLKEEMATHSSILAWRVPWTEEPGVLQSIGSQRVGHHWSKSAGMHYLWEEKNRGLRRLRLHNSSVPNKFRCSC